MELLKKVYDISVEDDDIDRMWDMSDCTFMASGDRRFLGNFFDLNFISITFERKL